jgi:multidrug efflux pump subunit AcrB
VRGIIAWFARNHVAANLLMFLIVAGGVFALPQIQQKSFPDIDVEVIRVTVPYLGAAPEEVEEGVCVRIEEEIQGINGIEKLSSTAAEGACTVAAELMSGYDTDRALSEIKNAVDAITTFPDEAEKPIVAQVTIRRVVTQLALSGDVDERTLKVYGQRIRDEIAALPGITQVELSNARDYEISIEVSEEALRRHQLSFDHVVEAVRRSSLDMPGGSLKTRRGEILLRTKGQAYVGRDFEDIVVLTRTDGTRLHLSEIATVVDGFEDDDRWASFDGEPAVLIQVFRVGDQKILELIETVKDYVEVAQLQLPEGLALTLWRDQSQSLRDRLDILSRNGRSGFILVFFLLACFLRLRLAFWVSIGVPISFMGALAFFPIVGISVDVISLFAFILVLGLLVDDAIVVGENIHSHQERAEDPLEASIVGTQEVSVPVIFGVLTTVAAFLPLVLAPGPMGQVFQGIGVVVILCLLFSLVESQLVLPSHLGHSRRTEEREATGAVQQRWKRIQNALAGSLVKLAEKGYRPLLDRALVWRYATLAGGVVLLVWCLTIVGAGHLRFAFFPPVESDYVTAKLTMPLGVPVEVTAEGVAALESAAAQLAAEFDADFELEEPMVHHVLASVGEQPTASHGPPGAFGGAGGSHLGEVSMELMSPQFRPVKAGAVADRWRELTPLIPDAVELTFSANLFSAGDPLNMRLQSGDVDDLRRAAESLKARLSEYPGVIDIRDSFREGKEEIKLSILPSAEALGLTMQNLARQVRQAFYGEEVQRIQREREDIKVMVRYPAEKRRSLGDLEGMRIRTPDGVEVPFDTVANAERGRGYAAIRRTDRQRVINVSADVDLTQTNANEVMGDLRSEFMPQLLAEHPGLRWSVEGEQREQQRVMMGMLRAYGLALLIIFTLLAIPLRSYAQPLIIMSVIPFGLVGAIGGHLIMGMNLSMMSVLGAVALSGVVVNSSLVMVHYINSRRAVGLPLDEAVRSAGVARFRPIVLTSLTTFAGLTPLLREPSMSAQFLIPMAISLAFGVAFATVISLFLVPSAYIVLEDLKTLLARRREAATSRNFAGPWKTAEAGAREVEAVTAGAPGHDSLSPDAEEGAGEGALLSEIAHDGTRH